MDIEKVETAAQGRIFSGIRALEAGLIDSLGGLSDAIQIARNLANIPDNKKVLFRKYPEPTFMEKLMNRVPSVAAFFAGIFKHTASIQTIADLLLPDADIRYRLERNGQIMPILPLEFSVK